MKCLPHPRRPQHSQKHLSTSVRRCQVRSATTKSTPLLYALCYKQYSPSLQFNEPDNDPGIFGHHVVARDASGHGNDLRLETPPAGRSADIKLVGAC